MIQCCKKIGNEGVRFQSRYGFQCFKKNNALVVILKIEIGFSGEVVTGSRCNWNIELSSSGLYTATGMG